MKELKSDRGSWIIWKQDFLNTVRCNSKHVVNSNLTLEAQLLEAASSLVKLNKPADKDYRSVLNYFWNTRPVKSQEEEWISRKEDLITLRPGREHAWLDSSVEHLLKWGNCRLVEVCKTSRDHAERSNTIMLTTWMRIRAYFVPKKHGKRTKQTTTIRNS